MGQTVGTPPVLTDGSDDIFWVNQLHTALDERGFAPGDEEVENWFFGEQTLSALLTFQVGAFLCIILTSACDAAAQDGLTTTVTYIGTAMWVSRQVLGCQRLEPVTKPPGMRCWALTLCACVSSKLQPWSAIPALL